MESGRGIYAHGKREKAVSKEKQTVVYELPPVIDEEELRMIFERTYGPMKRERNVFAKRVQAPEPSVKRPKKQTDEKEYLLVDGYNIIFAWEDLKELSEINIEAARMKLMDILSNYQGYRKQTLILVFDAYKVPGNVEKFKNITIFMWCIRKKQKLPISILRRQYRKSGRNIM